MGKKGQTIGGGMPGPGKSIISGGHGAGKYGQPHKFYGKSAAKYKGPHKMSQDHKMAYDRSEISRLEGDIHYDDMEKKGEGPGKMKKDKQKISKLQDDVLAGAAKYKYGKK